MLAAIVRFADELADEYTRTNRFVMDAATATHPGSEIYHAYADRLKRVPVNAADQSIELSFDVRTQDVLKKYQKQSATRYLIEEIMDRTLKMHREHIYCARFMLPDVIIDRINVRIDICTDDYARVLGTIRYSMSQQGYPGTPKRLADICPGLRNLTGTTLKKRVQNLAKDGHILSRYGEPQNLLVG